MIALRLAILAAAFGTAAAVLAADGTAIYAERCATCHGDGGAGDGPASAALEPRPRNFRDASFWQGRTTEQLTQVVKAGKPGTMMPPFAGTLSDADVDAVVRHVESFRPAARAH